MNDGVRGAQVVTFIPSKFYSPPVKMTKIHQKVQNG